MRKIFGIIISVALIAAALPVGAALSARAEEQSKPDEYYTYVQDFSDAASVNRAFHSYYKAKALGSSKAEEVGTDPSATDRHWCLSDGALTRINDVGEDEDGAFETNQIAILTFVKEAYLNFEMSLDFMSGGSKFWPVVGLRQVEEGKYYLDDGGGVFVQGSGKITLWGGQQISGPYEFGDVAGYSGKTWHNMRIVLLGDELSVSVDYQPWVRQSMKGYYETGYVSLFSVNDYCKFDNFRIKALAEPEEEKVPGFAPVAEPDAENSLTKMAGEVKPASGLFEREGKQNPDFEKTEITVTREVTEEGGCGGSAENAFLPLAFVAAASAFEIKRKKSERRKS